MSRFRWSDIRDAVFPAAGSARAIINSGSSKLEAYGTEVPADGIAGYAKSCIFLDEAAGKVYINEGTNTSCDFKEIETTPNVAGTAAGRGPSPLIWDDCPVLDFMLDPTEGWVYFNDFIDNGVVLAANQTVTRVGDVLVCTAATAGTVITTEADAREGEVKLETDTDDEDCILSALGGVHTSAHVTFEAGKKTWFEARVKNLNITDAKFGSFCGFAEEGLVATTTLIAAAGTMVDKDIIGFHSLEGDGDTYDTIHNTDGGGGITTLAGDAVTIEADTYKKLGMYCDGVTIFFYADGVLLADSVLVAATNVPDGEELAFYFSIMAAHGDKCSASIDWVRVAQEF